MEHGKYLVVPLGLALAAWTMGCEGDSNDPVDCTRMICAPDGAIGGTDSGGGGGVDSSTGGTDAGTMTGQDGGHANHDAGAGSDGGHANHDAGGEECAGDPVTVAEGGRFCEAGCYCRHPEQCLPIGSAPSCCHDQILCPTGEGVAGCRAFDPITGGDGVSCEHGFCLCAADGLCYSSRTAAACCDGPVDCF